MKKTFKPSKNQSAELFFIFLKQNKAYDAYMRNTSCPDLVHGIVDLNFVSPGVYIANAFFWAATPEGLDYWKLIDYKWNLVVDLFNL